MPLGNDINGVSAGDNFGHSLATSKSGDFVIIGAPSPYDDGKIGYAKVFHYKDDTQKWEQVGGDIIAKSEEKYLGWSVDINDAGDTVIIGSISNLARIYKNINGQWVQHGQDLVGENLGDQFGASVAISGDGEKVIIGGPSRGYVKVYKYSEDKWEQLGGFILGEKEWDTFGSAVDINKTGDVVIIGAPRDDGNGDVSGQYARVYQLINGEWVHIGQKLEGDRAGDDFGHSVAIAGDGKKVIVGVPNNNYYNGRGAGSAKVYEYNEGSQRWEQIGEKIVGREAEWDYSGSSVDIDDAGDTVVVGASPRIGGYARVYRYTEGKWEQQGQDLDERKEGEYFGFSVAISDNGEKVFIGGPWNDDNGLERSGQVHALEFQKPTAQPSSTPSMQPSFSNMPSMTPLCDDSPLKVLTDKKKGKKSAKYCSVIAKKTEKFCLLKQIKTHCPYTCGVCDKYGSADSTGSFIYNESMKDCKWLRNLVIPSKVSKVTKLCQMEEINATCRKTCSFFVQKCECTNTS